MQAISSLLPTFHFHDMQLIRVLLKLSLLESRVNLVFLFLFLFLGCENPRPVRGPGSGHTGQGCIIEGTHRPGDASYKGQNV
jgi:hypothetical protein